MHNGSGSAITCRARRATPGCTAADNGLFINAAYDALKTDIP